MLSAYLDGELTDAERAAVDARLEESAEWRAELDEVRAARDVAAGRCPSATRRPGSGTAVARSVDTDDDDRRRRRAGRADRLRADHRGARRAAAWALVWRRPPRPSRPWSRSSWCPDRSEVSPNVAAVVAQHGAQGSDVGDPMSMLAPVGPLAGFRR